MNIRRYLTHLAMKKYTIQSMIRQAKLAFAFYKAIKAHDLNKTLDVVGKVFPNQTEDYRHYEQLTREAKAILTEYDLPSKAIVVRFIYEIQ